MGGLESAAGGAPLHLLGALLAGELLPRDRELSVFASLRLLHPDLLEAAAAGASCVIQPGGSMRDDEVIKAADEAGLAMVLTGQRHFRH